MTMADVAGIRPSETHIAWGIFPLTDQEEPGTSCGLPGTTMLVRQFSPRGSWCWGQGAQARGRGRRLLRCALAAASGMELSQAGLSVSVDNERAVGRCQIGKSPGGSGGDLVHRRIRRRPELRRDAGGAWEQTGSGC